MATSPKDVLYLDIIKWGESFRWSTSLCFPMLNSNQSLNNIIFNTKINNSWIFQSESNSSISWDWCSHAALLVDGPWYSSEPSRSILAKYISLEPFRILTHFNDFRNSSRSFNFFLRGMFFYKMMKISMKISGVTWNAPKSFCRRIIYSLMMIE